MLQPKWCKHQDTGTEATLVLAGKCWSKDYVESEEKEPLEPI